jgi:hypothetical protein
MLVSTEMPFFTAVRTEYPQFPDDIQIAYSDLSMPWAGDGNITEDPVFADPAGFDLPIRNPIILRTEK